MTEDLLAFTSRCTVTTGGESTYDPWKRLACNIIYQACKDYVDSKRITRRVKYDEHPLMVIRAYEDLTLINYFFKSDYFKNINLFLNIENEDELFDRLDEIAYMPEKDSPYGFKENILVVKKINKEK